MGKIRFALLILIAIPALAKTPEIVLAESFLPDYVAQKEKVKPEEVRKIVLKKDKTFKDGVILLYPGTSCGIGVCSYYAFIKNARGSYEFAGHIDGLFKETRVIQNSNLPEIITQDKSGSEVSLEAKWIYNKASKVYEVQ